MARSALANSACPRSGDVAERRAGGRDLGEQNESSMLVALIRAAGWQEHLARIHRSQAGPGSSILACPGFLVRLLCLLRWPRESIR